MENLDILNRIEYFESKLDKALDDYDNLKDDINNLEYEVRWREDELEDALEEIRMYKHRLMISDKPELDLQDVKDPNQLFLNF